MDTSAEYILIVDDEDDILEINTMNVEMLTSIPILTASSGNKAIAQINAKGIAPKFIITDYKMPDGDGITLYSFAKEKHPSTPVIICSGNPLDQLKSMFPKAFDYIEKPDISAGLNRIIPAVLDHKDVAETIEYVGIRINFLRKLGSTKFDLYIKIGTDKYLKVVNSNENFGEAEFEHFKQKNITSLYITKSDAELFFKNFEQEIRVRLEGLRNKNLSSAEVTAEFVDSISGMAQTFGWTPSLVTLAQDNIDVVYNSVDKQKNLNQLLQEQMKRGDNFFVKHISMITVICIDIASVLGWTSQSTFTKITMAALLHDVKIAPGYLNELTSLTEKAKDLKEQDPTVLNFRKHPTDASNEAKKLASLPPDVETIILQHHEAPDGSGYPRGLTSSQIGALSCLFIIAEDMTHSVLNEENPKEAIAKFLADKKEFYGTGNFKKVFKAFEERLGQ